MRCGRRLPGRCPLAGSGAGAVGACLRARAAAVCAAALHIAELSVAAGLLRRRGGPVGSDAALREVHRFESW